MTMIKCNIYIYKFTVNYISFSLQITNIVTVNTVTVTFHVIGNGGGGVEL